MTAPNKLQKTLNAAITIASIPFTTFKLMLLLALYGLMAFFLYLGFSFYSILHEDPSSDLNVTSVISTDMRHMAEELIGLPLGLTPMNKDGEKIDLFTPRPASTHTDVSDIMTLEEQRAFVQKEQAAMTNHGRSRAEKIQTQLSFFEGPQHSPDTQSLEQGSADASVARGSENTNTISSSTQAPAQELSQDPHRTFNAAAEAEAIASHAVGSKYRAIPITTYPEQLQVSGADAKGQRANDTGSNVKTPDSAAHMALSRFGLAPKEPQHSAANSENNVTDATTVAVDEISARPEGQDAALSAAGTAQSAAPGALQGNFLLVPKSEYAERYMQERQEYLSKMQAFVFFRRAEDRPLEERLKPKTQTAENATTSKATSESNPS